MVKTSPADPLALSVRTGPFDVIGDVHGCRPELEELLTKLGYGWDGEPPSHPEGRTAVFLGDLTDRGPDSVGTVHLVHRMWRAGVALVAPGNHDDKLLRLLHGRNVQVRHGLETTLAEYRALPPGASEQFRTEIEDLFGAAAPYLVLDEGRLVVAHGGIRANMIGDRSRRTIDFVLYGDTTGRTTPEGLPERRDWAASYQGAPLVVYGHTPVEEAVLRNNTINVDTGCVFGGKLTAFRYPERELEQVAARRAYWPPAGEAVRSN
jgi:protein phosphatase